MKYTVPGLYRLIMLVALVGFLWLYLVVFTEVLPENGYGQGYCLFKSISHFPCPSCGITRSVLAIMKADFYAAFMFNPMGFVLFIMMFIIPIWVLTDIIRKRNTFLNFYSRLEAWLQRKPVAISIVLLVLANWIWNILKGI